MWKKNLIWRRTSVIGWVAFLTCSSGVLVAQGQGGGPSSTNAIIEAIEGNVEGKKPEVEVLRSGAQTWDKGYTNQVLSVGDRIHVGDRGRLAVRGSDQSIVRFGPKSDFQIIPAKKQNTPSFGFRLFSGLLYFFHRDTPTDVEVETQTASAAVRGTEFAMQVTDDGTTILTVVDGIVELSNALGPPLSVKNLQQGIAEPGKAPVLRPAIDAINNIIQWTFYYPGILDTEELPLNDQERNTLSVSLGSYRSGDLLRALAEYPAGRTPQSDAERIYLAALLLSVGQIDDAQRLLDSLPKIPADQLVSSHQRLADALRQLIAAVKLQPSPRLRAPELATEWMAESYYQQSLTKLPEALAAARSAVAKSPQFGFGWERVAELEFSFGRVDRASEALERGLQLSPRNAQAVALKGFLYAARNKIGLALSEFQKAIDIDGGLANAWLGRGLCRIRQNHSQAGREDLLIAAALEPQRSFLRSYLGKAWTDAGDRKRAAHELELAKQLDPRDPTAWLYSALLKQQGNEINEAIRDLEYSQDLSTNRAIYRSELLLDQDRAVRSANLAHIYRDAGMKDWSVLEAGRAVASDYANYSAHLFLANSYDELRDPNRINLRYETPAESEYLIANLLAPVGAGTLSQSISQGEYSKLFERDRLHVVSTTEYLSRGAWYENGAQFGTFGNSSYSIEGLYRSDPGQRPNNDFNERELRLGLKQQLSSKDTIYFRASHYEAEGGDLLQRFDPAQANTGLRTREEQDPILTLGYHREWYPGMHTLLIASRLNDTIRVDNPVQALFLVDRTPDGLDYVEPITAKQSYQSTLNIYSVEAQQIWQTQAHNTTVGLRFQTGDFDTTSAQSDVVSPLSLSFFPQGGNISEEHVETGFQRLSFYGYHNWRIVEPLLLVAGLAYDQIRFPEDFRASPVTSSSRTVDQFSPKAGLVWTPTKSTAVRGAYTRALSGASIDQSLAIEPTQVAGFNQSFRSLIPESVGGSDAGAQFETYHLSLEHRFPSRTYIAVTGEILYSKAERTLGSFDLNFSGFALPSTMPESLKYRERSLMVSVDQPIGEELSVGGQYRFSRSDVEDRYPSVLPGALLVEPFRPEQNLTATLHQLNLYAIFNHSSGFFAQVNGLWTSQESLGFVPGLPGDDFWQFNLFAGYRFARRRAEVTAGVMNLTSQDYKLNPLSLYTELPRERTFVARFKLAF